MELNNVYRVADTFEGVRRISIIERGQPERASLLAGATKATAEVTQNAHPVEVKGETSRYEFNAI
jgi:hypothetical protein